MKVKELYDNITKYMTAEQALMKLLEGQVMSYENLKFDDGKTIHPLHLITMAAMELGWGLVISSVDEENVDGLVVGTEKYIDSVEFKNETHSTLDISTDEMSDKLIKIREELNGEFMNRINYNDTRKKIIKRIKKEFDSKVTIICDETNNTPEIIDMNCLVARVYTLDNFGEIRYGDLVLGSDEQVDLVQSIINLK